MIRHITIAAYFSLATTMAFAPGCKKTDSSDDAADENSADVHAKSKNKIAPPVYADIESENNADQSANSAAALENASKNPIPAQSEDPNAIFGLTDGRKVVVCNKFSQGLTFAIGFKVPNGTITTTGWLELAAGECKVAAATNATHVFTYAKSADGKKVWKGDGGNLCLHPSRNFKTVSKVDDSTCDQGAGYTMKGFSTNTLPGDTFTVNFK